MVSSLPANREPLARQPNDALRRKPRRSVAMRNTKWLRQSKFLFLEKIFSVANINLIHNVNFEAGGLSPLLTRRSGGRH
jgi:hypothetical protein